MLSCGSISKEIVRFESLQGGNNRVYKLTTDTKDYLFKQYYFSDGDKRDRLKAEYAFLKFAREIGAAGTRTTDLQPKKPSGPVLIYPWQEIE
jgi:hypothetical protein